jgi:hypothetical protein
MRRRKRPPWAIIHKAGSTRRPRRRLRVVAHCWGSPEGIHRFYDGADWPGTLSQGRDDAGPDSSADVDDGKSQTRFERDRPRQLHPDCRLAAGSYYWEQSR